MLEPNFIIGVWAQPSSLFQRWKDRGINTLFGASNDVAKNIWELKAADAKLQFIDYAGIDPVGEAKQDYRIGFTQPDEPDMPSHIAKPGSTIVDLRSNYQKLKVLGKPVYLNLLGSAFDNIYYDGKPHPGKLDASQWGHRADSDGYMAQADIIGFDYHLWTSGRPGAFDITRRLLDRASDWSGRKPLFLYVETCTQGTGKSFTADDYELQVMQAVVYCAIRGYRLRGIIYFATQTAGSFNWPASFDITPPDVVNRMKIVNNRLTSWSMAVQPSIYSSPINNPPVVSVPLTLESLNDRVTALETKIK